MDGSNAHRSSFGFRLIAILVVLGIAHLFPYIGLLLVAIGLSSFGTRVFFLRWAVFPWVAVYPASALGPSPTGPPVGDWASLVQWVIVAVAFSAMAQRVSRQLAIVLAVATVIVVTLVVDSLLLPRLGMQFYLVGP